MMGHPHRSNRKEFSEQRFSIACALVFLTLALLGISRASISYKQYNQGEAAPRANSTISAKLKGGLGALRLQSKALDGLTLRNEESDLQLDRVDVNNTDDAGVASISKVRIIACMGGGEMFFRPNRSVGLLSDHAGKFQFVFEKLDPGIDLLRRERLK